jgi:hypothetical protein
MSGARQTAELDYRGMASQVVANGGKVFLFAATSAAAMPVTIPVNVALLLAWERGRCLLIDLDMERDAVGKAFEIEERNGEKPKALRTTVENLFVWPAKNFTKMGIAGAYKVIGRARDNADYVVVNAPGLMELEERGKIVRSCDGVFVYGENEGGEIARLASAFRCEVMRR